MQWLAIYGLEDERLGSDPGEALACPNEVGGERSTSSAKDSPGVPFTPSVSTATTRLSSARFLSSSGGPDSAIAPRKTRSEGRVSGAKCGHLS